MVMALLRSQAKNMEHFERVITGTTKLKPTPVVPEKNIWGRQIPEKRVNNMMHRWYARQVKGLMPPLPEHEFERLQALSMGNISRDEGPVSRRRRAANESAERDSVVNEKVLLEGPQKSHTFAAYTQGRPHRFTKRLLRSSWLNVINHVPMMTRDSTSGKWSVKWTLRGRARPPQFNEVSGDRAEALFGAGLT